MAGVFTPWKLAHATTQGWIFWFGLVLALCLPREQVIKHLPALLGGKLILRKYNDILGHKNLRIGRNFRYSYPISDVVLEFSFRRFP